MDRETMTMSHKELDRVGVIRQLVDGALKQCEAALQLGLSTRQVKRLARALRHRGAAGLASKRRGQPGNNRIAAAVRERYIGLVRTHYADFGPTLAQEKLAEERGFGHSVETLRAWMIAAGLWQPRPRRQASIHQRRPRRPCRGELAQIDGSPHAWFEDRGAPCCLIVFIDAANAFLPEFITHYNARFAKPPQSPSDAHRPVLHHADELHLIFSLHHTRKLSKNLSCQFRHREYPITGQGKGYRLRGTLVTLCEHFDGSMSLLSQRRPLTFRLLEEGEPPIPIDNEKSVHARIDQFKHQQTSRPAYKPPPDHPWKRAYPNRIS